MALNIGNLNFGVDANTQGLQKAVTQMSQFRKVVNATAKSQADGAKQTTNALTRQESAIKKAFQQTLRLQQAQRKAGAAPSAVAQTTRAFSTLTKEMTSGRVSTLEFTRSVDAFNARLGRLSRSLKQVEADKAAQKMNKLNQVVKQLESASVLAIGPLSGLGSRIRAIGAITTRSSLIMAAFIGTVAATVVVIGKLIQSSIQASRVFESANARFLATSGSLVAARKEMAFVIATSRELGLRIDTSAKAFSRLTASTRGTALEGEGVRQVFTAVSQAAAALRLESTEVEGTFRAIEQIMSKGSVQAEELRGQLGERLPGAFRIAAEAMGVTTQRLGQMLKSGEVLSDDFLPKFTAALTEAFAGASKGNVNSFTGSFNNLANAGLLFSKAFNEVTGVSKIAIGIIKTLTSVIDLATLAIRNLVPLVTAAATAMAVLWGPQILAGVIAVGNAIRSAAVAMVGFNIALAANPLGKLAGVIVRVVLALAASVAAFFGMKILMDEAGSSAEGLANEMDKLAADVLTNTSDMASGFKSLVDEIDETTKELAVMREVVGFLDRFGDTPELLKKRFITLNQVIGKSPEELQNLADQLAAVTGKSVAATVDDVAEAWFRYGLELDNLNAIFEKTVARNERTIDAVKDVGAEFQTLTARIDALKQGQGAVEIFDAITSKTNALKIALQGTNLTTEQRAELIRTMTDLLQKQFTLEKAIAKAAADAITSQREADRLAEAQSRKMEKIAASTLAVTNETARLQMRLAALNSGPASFEVFTRIQEPLDKLLEKLIKQGLAVSEINRLMRERKDVLVALFEAEQQLSDAGVTAANAVGDALENIILKTESAGDALRQLARELLRVFLRAAFLDPFVKGLGNIFTSGFSAAGVTGSAAPLGVPAHTGGTFKVGGTGGPDSQRASFAVTPGEEILIRRPDQKGVGGGGGGNTFIINAPGADAGTIERMREIVRVEFVPQILAASTKRTVDELRRPRFA